MIGFSVVDSLNGSSRGAWTRTAEFTATPVLSCINPSIDVKFGKSESVVENEKFDELSPVSGGRLDDWTEVLSKSRHEREFELDDGDVLVNGSGSEGSQEDERVFGGFMGERLRGLKDIIGQAVSVNVPTVRACLGKWTAGRVQYLASCISWYLNSSFSSMDDVDYVPDDLAEIPDVDDSSASDEIENPSPVDGLSPSPGGDESDDFYSAYGGSVYSSAFQPERTSPLPIPPCDQTSQVDGLAVHAIMHTDSLTPSSNAEMIADGGVKCLCVSIVVEQGMGFVVNVSRFQDS
jgi:hypothetical protein